MSLTQTGTTLSGNRRLPELDATRGLIMILMALGLAALYLPCKAFVDLKRKSSLDSIFWLF
jgi:uncharacterized membrane protein